VAHVMGYFADRYLPDNKSEMKHVEPLSRVC
jgi:hypothetical protein